MLDTLRFATRLKRSGFENGQAEGMARALAEEMGNLLERLATKADLAAIKHDLETQIGALRSDFAALNARLEALEAKVDAMAMQIKFMFAILTVLLALGLIDTVPRFLG